MRVFGSVVLLILTVGCVNTPSDMPMGLSMTNSSPFTECVELGPVAAEATCACSNKRTYDRLQREAEDRLQSNAQSLYPTSDAVSVSGIDLYMNNAVATGIAYRCSAG